MESKTDAKHIIKNVEVLDIADDGKAIAKTDDMIVILSGAVPGDVVDIHPKKWKRNYIEAEITGIVKHSEKRTEPECVHFGICGGCKWQNMKYEAQLFFKQKQVEECMKRIGKIDSPPILPIIKSDEIYFYRNKLEYTFSAFPEPALGFHLPGRFNRVLNIEHCHLQRDPSDAIRLGIKKFAYDHGLTFYDIERNRGFLRNLIIRTSTVGELMVILSFYHEDEIKRNQLLEYLQTAFPEITSLMFVINSKGNDTLFDREIKLFSGRDYITEKIGNLNFRIGAKSFFQVNTMQAEKLFNTAVEFAGLTGKELVYDLFTGNGGIAFSASSFAKKVTGIELNADAVQEARTNAEINKITNVEFVSGDIRKVFGVEFIAIHGKPDVIFADPPRAGLDKKVIEQIMKSAPERLIYVSCNPATQARDIAILSSDYLISKLQPIDMFPQTHHVESIALLLRKQ